MLIDLLQVIRGVRQFQEETFQEMRPLFEELSSGQHPKVLFITCIDSRIDPHLITDSNPGSMLIKRNMGNIIPKNDEGTSGSEEAATFELALDDEEGLKIKNIIICGHQDCGAMTKLLHPSPRLRAVAAWLKHSAPVLERIKDTPENLRLENAIKENVLVQMEHLKTYPEVKKRLASGELSVHGWVYDFKHGKISVYVESKKAFLPFEEAFQIALEARRDRAVKKIVSAYLDPFSHPADEMELGVTMRLFSRLQVNLKFIWPHIKASIFKALWEEIGGFFPNQDSPAFHDLIESGVNLRLDQLKDFRKELQESTGYNQLCSKLIRQSWARGSIFTTPNEDQTVFNSLPSASI